MSQFETTAATPPTGVVDPRLSDLPAIIGRARGHALSAGALAIACATATSDTERVALASDMSIQAQAFIEAIEAGAREQRVAAGKSRLTAERKIVKAFSARLAALPPEGAGLTRDVAVDLARDARETVNPAIYRMLSVIQEDEGLVIDRRLAEIRDKAAMVDPLIVEMGRIGRMIGMISINASVEAARAGGESGRAFQVIAEEVRTLARRSSDVLDRIRSRLAEATPDRPRGSRHL